MFFVETAGVSFWFTGNSNIVKQKDATVEKRIHKGNRKKKEEISVSSKKKCGRCDDEGRLTFEWKRHELCFG